MSPKSRNNLIAVAFAGAVGGAFFNYPGAMISAWAASARVNRKAGMKKIAIDGGIGTVAGLASARLFGTLSDGRF